MDSNKVGTINKLRYWWHKKMTKRSKSYTFGEPLLDHPDMDIINERIQIIMKRMKEIEDEMKIMKEESVKNKKRIRNLKEQLELKEEIISNLQKQLIT